MASFLDTVRSGDVAAVVRLLESNAELANAKDRDDGARRALHYAATTGSIEMAEALLVHGARPDVQDADGSTPLHHAAGRGDMAMIELLRSGGASCAVRNNGGYRPFDAALASGSREAVDYMRAWTFGSSDDAG